MKDEWATIRKENAYGGVELDNYVVNTLLALNIIKSADIAGTNTTSFIREAALEKADKIILTEEEGK